MYQFTNNWCRYSEQSEDFNGTLLDCYIGKLIKTIWKILKHQQ